MESFAGLPYKPSAYAGLSVLLWCCASQQEDPASQSFSSSQG